MNILKHVKVMFGGEIVQEPKTVPLFYPSVGRNAIKYVTEVLESKWLAEGPKTAEFEDKLNQWFGQAYTVLTNSGTNALHIAYQLAGIQEGDDVLTPVLTCVATNTPLLTLRANPIFVDIDPKTLTIDPEDIKRKLTPKTKAIIVVHFGGIPCAMDEINAIAQERGIPVIEDAAQAMGAYYKGQKIGNSNNITIFSLQAIKNLTTGDGGILRLPNEKYYEIAKRMKWFGIDRTARRGEWEGSAPPREINNDIKEVGYKYNMNDIASAIGLAGLEELDIWLITRACIALRYNEAFKKVSGITLLQPSYYYQSSYWLYQILVERRVDFVRMMQSKGIEVSLSHVRNDSYSVFKKQKFEVPNMDKIESQYICLPINPHLSGEDVSRVIDAVKGGW